MVKILNIKARQILDSRGNPTVEAEMETEAGNFVASVPSGASCGEYEAVEIRDGDKSKFLGKGVSKAVNNIKEIIKPVLKGKEIRGQRELDQILISLDGTENKSKLGANAILPVSVAFLRANAAENHLPLYKHIASEFGFALPGSGNSVFPRACFNILNGGVHAGNNLDVQEFMVIPFFDDFSTNLRAVSEIYHTLKSILEEKFGKDAVNVGDEGGFAPPLAKTEEALSLISQAISQAGYEGKIKIGLDCAASQFFKNGEYYFEGEQKTAEELLAIYLGLAKQFPILFIEDPFDEEDWDAWELLKPIVDGGKQSPLFFGDDLTVTNSKRLEKAISKKCINGLIIKPNQIGSVSEAVDCVKVARENNLETLVSHRSGDTCDSFVADLAVGISSPFLKSGAPARGERLAKYNRLLAIEEEIKGLIKF